MSRRSIDMGTPLGSPSLLRQLSVAIVPGTGQMGRNLARHLCARGEFCRAACLITGPARHPASLPPAPLLPTQASACSSALVTRPRPRNWLPASAALSAPRTLRRRRRATPTPRPPPPRTWCSGRSRPRSRSGTRCSPPSRRSSRTKSLLTSPTLATCQTSRPARRRRCRTPRSCRGRGGWRRGSRRSGSCWRRRPTGRTACLCAATTPRRSASPCASWSRCPASTPSTAAASVSP